jgi:hypothetical protein
MDHISGSSGGNSSNLIHSTSSLANKQQFGAAGSSSASAVTAPTVDTNTPVVAGKHPALGVNFWKSVAVGTGASASVTHGKQAADAAPMSKRFTRLQFDAVGKALHRLQCDFSCSWTTPIKTYRWDLKRSGNGWTATGPDPKNNSNPETNWTVETSPSELLSTVAYDIRVEIPAAHVQAFEAALAAEVGPDTPSMNNTSVASMLSRHGVDATGEDLKSFLASKSAPGAAHEALPHDLLKLYIDNHHGDRVNVNVHEWEDVPESTDSSKCIVAYSDDDGRPCYLEFDQHWTIKMPDHADRSLGVNGVYVDIGGRLNDAMAKELGKNGPVTVLHLLPKASMMHGKQVVDAAPMSKPFTKYQLDAVGKALDRLQCDFSCSWITPRKTERWDFKRSGDGWTATRPDPETNWTFEASPSELLSTVAYDVHVEIPAAHVQAFEAELAAEVGPDAPSMNNTSVASMLSRHGVDATGEELKSFLESVSAPGTAHEALPLDLLELYIDNHHGDSVNVNVHEWEDMPWSTDSSECIVAYSDDDGRPCYLEFDRHWTVKMPDHADRSLGVNGVYVDIGDRLNNAMVKQLGKNGPVTVLHLLPRSAGTVQSTASAVGTQTVVQSVRRSTILPLTMSANENDSLMPLKNPREWTSRLDRSTAAFGKFLDYVEEKRPGQPPAQLQYRDFMHLRRAYISEKSLVEPVRHAKAALTEAAVDLYGHTWMLAALAEGRKTTSKIWKGLEFETHLMNLNPPLSCAMIKENPGAHKDAFYNYRNDPGNNEISVKAMLSDLEPHLEISPATTGMPVLQPSSLDTRLPLQGTARDNDSMTADLTAFTSTASGTYSTRNRHAAEFLKYAATKDKDSGPMSACTYQRFVTLRASYLKDKGREKEVLNKEALNMFSEMAAAHYPNTWAVRSSLGTAQHSMNAYLDFDAHLMTRTPFSTSLAGLAEAGDNGKRIFFDLYGVKWEIPNYTLHLASIRKDTGIASDSLRMLDALRGDMPISDQYFKAYIVHFEPMLQQEGIDLADPRLGTADDGSDRRKSQIAAFNRAKAAMYTRFPGLKQTVKSWIANLQACLFP